MTSLIAKLGDGWIHPERVSTGWKPLVVFLLLTCLIVTSCWVLGPYPVTKFPKDTIYALSQGDLILQGKRPYVDYYSMHGPVPFLFSAVAMSVYGISMESILLTQILGALVFGALMFKIASSRVNGFWAVYLAIAVELILVNFTPIGSKSWREFTWAMWYNPLGYCIEATVFLYLLAPSRARSRLSLWSDHLIIASLLMACFLTKLSYFAPTVIVFVVATVILPQNRQSRILGLIVLAVAVALCFAVMGALGGSIPDYLEFLSIMKLKVSPIMLALRFVHYTRTVGLFVLGILLLAWYASEVGVLRQHVREFLLVPLMLGCILVSASTSAQDLEMLPLLGVIPLGLAVTLNLTAQRRSFSINKYLVAAGLGVALLLSVHEPKNSILSWAFSHTTVRTIADPVERVSLSEIKSRNEALSLRVDPSLFTWMPKDWTDEQFDAIALLQRNGFAKDEVLYVAADVSFINLLMGVKYPQSFVVWWPFGYIDDPQQIRLLDEHLLEDADWILQNSEYKSFWEYLEFVRGDFIDAHFDRVDASGKWTLYHRKSK